MTTQHSPAAPHMTIEFLVDLMAPHVTRQHAERIVTILEAEGRARRCGDGWDIELMGAATWDEYVFLARPKNPTHFIPTANPEYDALRRRWAKEAGRYLPEHLNPTCDYCDQSVANKPIHDNGCAWICDDCAEHDEMWPSDEAERQAERAQMGRSD